MLSLSAIARQIVYNMQNIFNLLPNLNVDELVRSMLVKTNDMHLVIYVSALIRSVAALHDLVNNKVSTLLRFFVWSSKNNKCFTCASSLCFSLNIKNKYVYA